MWVRRRSKRRERQYSVSCIFAFSRHAHCTYPDVGHDVEICDGHPATIKYFIYIFQSIVLACEFLSAPLMPFHSINGTFQQHTHSHNSCNLMCVSVCVSDAYRFGE